VGVLNEGRSMRLATRWNAPFIGKIQVQGRRGRRDFAVNVAFASRIARSGFTIAMALLHDQCNCQRASLFPLVHGTADGWLW
jgi:hypothetical protein